MNLRSFPLSTSAQFERIPHELRSVNHWVCWREEVRDGEPTKIPYDAKTGARAKSNDAKTWTTFAQACSASAMYHGIGFQMLGSDFLGFDFDTVLQPDGTPEPIIPVILKALGDPYCEVTPSGEGLRAFISFSGTLPGSGRKFIEKRNGKKYGAELYAGSDAGRYFTVTGSHHCGNGVPAPRDLELAYLLVGNILDEKVKKLFLGDTSEYGNDQSRADLAMSGMLVRIVGPDADRIDHFFRASKLMREKWDSKRGAGTYGSITIAAALGGNRVSEPLRSDSGNVRRPTPDTISISPFRKDLANAERFVAQYSGLLIYCADRRIHCAWNGRVWHLDDPGAWRRAGKEIIRGLYVEAAATADPTAREMLAKHALWSESRIDQMLDHAQSDLSLERSKFRDTFDLDHLLLNCDNGILNLATGELEPHRADAMITKITRIGYDRKATCPQFEKFLVHTFQRKTALIQYVQNLLGYCLSGSTKEHAFWVFYGEKDTSKSTLVKLFRGLLGEYGTTLPKNAIVVDYSKNQDHAFAELAGVRLAATTELTDDHRFDVAAIKQITGQDWIKASKKYQNFFEFQSTAKLVMATNHRPVIRETDDAIWGRVKSVPFLVQIPLADQVDKLEEKLLEAEGPGILAWAVRGFQNWQKYGLQEPEEVRAAVTQYREEQDVVRNFILDECDEHADLREQFGALYGRYCSEVKSSGGRPMSGKKFGKELDRLGHLDEKSHGIHYRLGLRLSGGDFGLNGEAFQ